MANRRLLVVAAVLLAAGVVAAFVLRGRSHRHPATTGWVALDHVADGDTIVVQGRVTVRLVQIDTPEVFYKPECFGKEASAETKRLLPPGTLVRLIRDPATDPTDRYGRLLRYVVRRDGLNINLRLVVDGAAAPYFFDAVRGAHAALLMREARAARAAGKGLWSACPGVMLTPDEGVSTGPPRKAKNDGPQWRTFKH